MTHFPDLSPYDYLHPEDESPNTVNIGWLEPEFSFTTGRTSKIFQEKLSQLVIQRFKQTRGFHSCRFCNGLNRPGGSAELRVVGAVRIYAAPSLIYHYVTIHNYRPPKEFIEAVLAWKEPQLPRD